MNLKYLLKLILGPSLFTMVYLLPLEGLEDQGRFVLGTALWIAAWWITEAIPLAITSLLPLILFPLGGALSIGKTGAQYGSPIIFLFMGGFILALAVERCNLHKRIALFIIYHIGTDGQKIILGFMLATAILSMWISNTAAALMILPVGLALFGQIKSFLENHNTEKGIQTFGKALMLGIAYSASIGGTATLIGSPTNLVFSGAVATIFDEDVSFLSWMLFAAPIAIVLLIFTWVYLTRIIYKIPTFKIPGIKVEIEHQRESLGKMTNEEKNVIIVFGLVSFFWVTRTLLWQDLIPGLNDTIIALAGALLLFVIPDSKGEKFLMDWEGMKKLPWNILLLFGGGLALASGFQDSGLAGWIGEQFSQFRGISFFLILLITIASINFLTEVTSNVATASVFMPVFASLALGLGIHPYFLMVGTSMAASYAFMLPVATPPNAVVFGSNLISIRDMVRAGFGLNIISILILTLMCYWFLGPVWSIE